VLLGSPLQIGRLRLRNRVVSPPMERNYGTPDGCVTDQYRAYLQARAAGGAALLFTEATYVRADGRGRVRQLGAHGDHVMPGLARLAGAIHARGALLGVELNHAGRVADPTISGFQPVAPSPAAFRGRMPRVLSTAEVEAIVEAFAVAARRCVDAGVDVVEVHAAHGYLLHQFLSPHTNRRADRYGDPVCLLNEVLIAVHDVVPESPLVVRLSAFDGDPAGLDADATLALAGRTRLDLVDVVDISAGSYTAGEWIVQPGEVRPGVLAPYAARYRRFGRPVCVAGRITTAAAAEEILRAGHADLVAIGRALHADPDWTWAVLAGKAPRPCIGCNQGCIDRVHTQQPITCTVNPATSHEWRPAVAVSRRRRVVVVGGGVAGLEAARAAAVRGHRVVLFEAAPQLGGQYRLAAVLPTKSSFAPLLDWYEGQLGGLGVDLRLSTPAAPGMITREEPDAVVVAVGAVGYRPAVPGIDEPRVVDLRAWLAAAPSIMEGAAVTVWGADRPGVAVADMLAAGGCRVLIVGTQAQLAPEAGHREKVLAVARLERSPEVTVRLDTTVEAIDRDRLLLGCGGEREWVTAPGPVLVSQGVVPVRFELPDSDQMTYVIGEGGGATTAAQAIRQGAAAAERLG
jgi:2,4-dienoyl-CoA reductase-like NADH-dependent reductase (Old Yellow Enzyme family)